MATRARPRRGRHRATGPSGWTGRRRDGQRRGFFRRFWWIFALTPLVVIAGLLLTLWLVYASLSVPDAPPAPETTFVYDRNGKVVTTLHGEVNRVEIPLSRVPEHLRNAVIAIEDKGFYEHGGVSIFGIVRAAWANVTSGRIEQGGSTITQQYVKNVYVGSERTVTRKLKEAILAVKLERRYSKDEILGRYLNTVYFGNGAYGVQAAALSYFGVPARSLTIPQAATLAGIIQRPEAYDPVEDQDAATARRNVVLQRMADLGHISQAELAEARAAPMKVRRPRTQSSSRFAYFVDYVRRGLLDEFGADLTYGGGLKVRTTLDSTWQRAAEEAVATHLSEPTDPSAALVAIDPANGAVRALVGGRDFSKVKFNNAIQARRQPGSAFKPFTLAAAFEQSISPNSVWNGPSSIVIPDERCFTNGRPWEVSNYADAGSGTMDLIGATANSVNTIYAQLVVEVGPEHVVRLSKRMGIETDIQPVCSVTLGSQDVTPMELTAAYATVAARGVRHETTPFDRVTEGSGRVLLRSQPRGEQALDRNDADLVTFALQAVVEGGTGTAADIGRPVAGKTGTSQNYTNAWFCGYTPQLAACVWVGHQKADIPMENVQGYANVSGGSIPALIWHDFMAEAMKELPVKDFPEPSFAGYDRDPTGIASSPSPSPSPKRSPSTTTTTTTSTTTTSTTTTSTTTTSTTTSTTTTTVAAAEAETGGT